jgi:hypothetical protein
MKPHLTESERIDLALGLAKMAIKDGDPVAAQRYFVKAAEIMNREFDARQPQ